MAMFSTDHFLFPSVCFTGQGSKNVSASPSIESLSGGREYTGSPPLSATKKESFFSTISHSRSHSRSMSKKESVSPYCLLISYCLPYLHWSAFSFRDLCTQAGTYLVTQEKSVPNFYGGLFPLLSVFVCVVLNS